MTVTNFYSNCLDPTFPSSDEMLYLVKRGQPLKTPVMLCIAGCYRSGSNV